MAGKPFAQPFYLNSISLMPSNLSSSVRSSSVGAKRNCSGKLIVVSLIDNLVKGQAGSAVQNMNIMFGLEENAGLLKPGLYP